jgi:hypothetical protein
MTFIWISYGCGTKRVQEMGLCAIIGILVPSQTVQEGWTAETRR